MNHSRKQASVPTKLCSVLALTITAAVLIATCLSAGCGSRDASGQGPSLAHAGFGDGEWELHVDRAWDGSGGPAFPWQPLDEESYEPISDGPTYPVTISDDMATISLGRSELEGNRASASEERVLYELSVRTFAGGRFVVWATERGLQAERTIYGSGRPITKSERGPLLPNAWANKALLPTCYAPQR